MAFFTVVAALATVHLARDVIAVATHVTSLASLREIAVAAAVIVGGAAWLAIVARLASRPGDGARLAIAAAFATLVIVRLAVAFAYDGEMGGEGGVYHNRALSRPRWAVLRGGAGRPTDGLPGHARGRLRDRRPDDDRGRDPSTCCSRSASGSRSSRSPSGTYGARVGAIAVTCYALWPAGALVITARLPETAYDLAIVVAAYAAVATRQGWRGSALTGVLLGLSQYIRPTSPALIPAFVLARIWPGAPWRRILGGALAPMLVTFLIVLVPIMAWNLSTRGVPDISTSAYGGKSLHHGTDVRSGGRWSRRAANELKAIAGADTWEHSRVGLAHRDSGGIRDDPVGIGLLALRKQYTLWGSETYGVRYGIRRELAGQPWLPRSVMPSLASGVFYVAITAATALGLYLRRHRPDALSALLIATALSISLIHSLVEVRDRYHSYAMPLLMPIAAVAIVAVLTRVALAPVGRHRRDAGGGSGRGTTRGEPGLIGCGGRPPCRRGPAALGYWSLPWKRGFSAAIVSYASSADPFSGFTSRQSGWPDCSCGSSVFR